MMKLYDSRYRYSKLDHEEIKNLVYQLICFVRENKAMVNVCSNFEYCDTNFTEYYITTFRPSKIDISYRPKGYNQYFEIRDIHVKINWYSSSVMFP